MKILIALLFTVALASAETFTVTAYCPCQKCCGPLAPRRTASNVWPTQGVTIAAPRRIPFGTRLNIEGLGVRTVQDRLARRFDNRIDVFFASHADALQFGKQTLTVNAVNTKTP